MDVFMNHKNVTLSSKAIKIKIAPAPPSRFAHHLPSVHVSSSLVIYMCVARTPQPMMTALLAPLFLFIGVIAVPIGACAG